MKKKLIALGSLMFLGMLMLQTSSLEAKHHRSTSVQFQFGTQIAPPAPYYYETYVMPRPHYYPHYYPQKRIYVHPAPVYREVYVYPAPVCPHCR